MAFKGGVKGRFATETRVHCQGEQRLIGMGIDQSFGFCDPPTVQIIVEVSCVIYPNGACQSIARPTQTPAEHLLRGAGVQIWALDSHIFSQPHSIS